MRASYELALPGHGVAAVGGRVRGGDDVIKTAILNLAKGPAESQVQAIRALEGLAASNEARSALIADGAVKPLVTLLAGNIPEGRVRAACALERLAHTSACRTAIVTAGALPPLVKLLSGASEEGREVAARAVAALATTDRARAEFVAAGALPPLIGLLSQGGDLALRAAEALATLFDGRGGDERAEAAVAAGVLSPLLSLVSAGAVETGATGPVARAAEKACAALASLACSNAMRNTIAEADAIPTLVRLLTAGAPDARVQAAAAIARLAAKDDASIPLEREVAPLDTEAFLDVGVIPHLVELLTGGVPEGRAQAARAIFMLACREGAQAAVLQAAPLPGLVILLREGHTAQGRAWAAGALRCLATTAETREAIERAVPLGQPGRESFLKTIQVYCY